MPWAAVKSSIASDARTFLTTLSSFRAAMLPMLTWSSLPALEGMLSTLAGWHSTLFSLTSAALVGLYLLAVALLQPLLEPLTGGSALAVAASTCWWR